MLVCLLLLILGRILPLFLSLSGHAYLIKSFLLQGKVYTAQVTHINLHSPIIEKLRQPEEEKKPGQRHMQIQTLIQGQMYALIHTYLQ